MRTVLTLFKWIAIFAVLALLAIIGLPWFPVLKDKTTAAPFAAYIEENAVTLDPRERDLRIELPEELAAKRFILVSEIHGFADAHLFDFALLRTLNKDRGVRIILAEYGPDWAMAMNRLILDGDEEPAKEVLRFLAEQSAQWASEEHLEKLRRIRDLNRFLPDSRKIVFVGVDQIYDRAQAEERLAQLAFDTEPGLSTVDGLRGVNTMLLEESLERGDDAGRYTHIIENIALLTDLPGAEEHQFYGFWGIFHGIKVKASGAEPLAYRLNSGDVFRDDVASITILCAVDCASMMPARTLPEPFQGPGGEPYSIIPQDFANPYLMRARGVDEFTSYLEDQDAEALFLSISDDNSPYKKGKRIVRTTGYLSLVLGISYDGSAGEAMDAVIIHRNSPALTPFENEAYDVVTGETPGR